MRRRLVVLSLATTVLVVVAFVVPLALLVRQQAEDTARDAAERNAQSVAGLVALALAVTGDPGQVSSTIGELPAGTVVVLGGTVIGDPLEGQGSLVAEAAETRTTVAGYTEGGWEIALPVVGASGAVSTILGAYAVTYPKATVSTLIFFGFITIVEIPALVWLGLWLGGQLLDAFFSRDLGVAVWAHIGGFAAGAFLMPILSFGAPPPGSSWAEELKKHFSFDEPEEA